MVAFLDAMGLGRYKENMPEIDEKTRGKVLARPRNPSSLQYNAQRATPQVDLDDVIDIFTELRDKTFVPSTMPRLLTSTMLHLSDPMPHLQRKATIVETEEGQSTRGFLLERMPTLCTRARAHA